jgi:hypothetical protein
LGTTVTGLKDLVTGRLAGSSADSCDVDGGVTSIRSPDIALPPAGELALSFRYYLAHGNDASAADYFRLTVVGPASTVVFEELGNATNDDGTWGLANVNLNDFAGQTVYLLVEAADAGPDSLVEAAIDDVRIVATGLNQPPTADPKLVWTAEDTPVDILLTGSDPDDDPLTYSLVLSPSHGILSGTAPSLVYRPAANYYGPDVFSFVVDDGQATSEPALVQIGVTAVNDAPLALPQAVRVRQGRSVAITLGGTDVETDTLTYDVVVPPVHGILSGTGPERVYTPAPGYVGPDSFSFVVDDGELASAPAMVDITVVYAVYVPVVVRAQN